MQKDSFLKNESPVVQFSKLDQNNKAQFLQFLIKNNITFDNGPGKQNVIAKVTLKTIKPNKTLTNKQIGNNQTKKVNTKVIQNTKKVHQSDKQNCYHLHENKKTNDRVKTPLKQKSSSNLTKQFSPFKQVKLSGKDSQVKDKSGKQKKQVNDSFGQIKSFRHNQKERQKSVTPQRKLYSQCSPAKPNLKPTVIISKPNENISPMKSENTTNGVKQSQNRLSTFRKSMIATQTKTCFYANELKHSKSKSKAENKSREKIRDKSPGLSQNTFSSKQSLRTQNKTRELRNSSFEQTLSSKNPSFQTLQRIQLVNKYKNYLGFHSNKSAQYQQITQRPVCWPLNQLEKFLDEFYDDSFSKNTYQMLNNSKKLCQTLSKDKKKGSPVCQALQGFMSRKFNKVQKSIEYNLINFLYSIAYYLNESKLQQQQKQSLSSLILFQSFIQQTHSFQQYLFFLFARNILKQDFRKTFNTSVMRCTISKKEIDRFLKHIVGQNNEQVLKEYHRIIFQKIQTYDIEVNTFMKILVEDYQAKREHAQQSARNKNQEANQYDTESENMDINQEDSSLENTFNKILNLGFNKHDKMNIFDNSDQIIPEDSMQELTFGQDTKQMLKQVDLDSSKPEQTKKTQANFWQSPYVNHTNSSQEKQKLLKDQFNQMIIQKLCQKTNQLVQILLEANGATCRSPNRDDFENSVNDSDQNSLSNESQQIQELLFSKALCLFLTVVQMNKVKWLKELHITNPTQQDIQKVQQIQLLFRKIKQYPSAKDIAEFCKLILTVTQITEELSKFFL